MLKNIEKTEKKINSFFDRLDFITKIVLIAVFVTSILLNSFLVLRYATLKHNYNKLETKSISELERASEQYKKLYSENAYLEKKFKTLNLELIKTINNTVDLQEMLNQILNEAVTLYSIKDELDSGIKKTTKQLNSLQKIINSMIDEKQQLLDSAEFNMFDEKGKL